MGAKLRRRQPQAAPAPVNRDFKTCDQLTEKADTISGLAVELPV
jgi:hypothetical protein